MDLEKVNMAAVFKHFGLNANTCDFIGHALALHRDDSYLESPARPTIDKIRLYFESLARYLKSPYIYPLYGLGELPQAFARLSAIYGGTYMLDRKFEGIEYGPDGKFVGVRFDGQVVKAKFVVGDPSYFPDKVKKTGQVIRCINILKGTIPNTKDADSAQVIIPQKHTKRHHDTYISMVSANHKIAADGFRVATVSTTVETANPVEELKFAIGLLPEVLESFVIVKDVFEPNTDGVADQVFISKSYDATSHFETASLDILDIWKRITGHDLDLSKSPVAPEDDGAGPSSSGQ
jgi:Rab GDP dissociation inhibitor